MSDKKDPQPALLACAQELTPELAAAIHGLNVIAKAVHETSKRKGWYEKPRTVGDELMLQVTEIAESMEEFRDGHDLHVIRYDDHGKPLGYPIEQADVLIRVLDTVFNKGIDIGEAVRVKMAYNETRPHRHGGKKL